MRPRLHASAPLRVVRSSDADRDSPIDSNDLDALYRRYSAYVAVIATRLLGRGDEVDDLVQDVFVAALSGVSRMRDPSAIKGWLARVTVRLALKRLRKRRLLQALHLDSQLVDYQQLTAAGTSAAQRELLARVYRTLDRLPAQTRVIWLLRHVLDEPLQSIVEWVGCSQSTVQRKLRDAESFIAQELDDV